MTKESILESISNEPEYKFANLSYDTKQMIYKCMDVYAKFELQSRIDEFKNTNSKHCNCSEPKIYRKWGEVGCDKCNKLINPTNTNN